MDTHCPGAFEQVYLWFFILTLVLKIEDQKTGTDLPLQPSLSFPHCQHFRSLSFTVAHRLPVTSEQFRSYHSNPNHFPIPRIHTACPSTHKIASDLALSSDVCNHLVSFQVVRNNFHIFYLVPYAQNPNPQSSCLLRQRSAIHRNMDSQLIILPQHRRFHLLQSNFFVK